MQLKLLNGAFLSCGAGIIVSAGLVTTAKKEKKSEHADLPADVQRTADAETTHSTILRISQEILFRSASEVNTATQVEPPDRSCSGPGVGFWTFR
jgi:hypothetical protein